MISYLQHVFVANGTYIRFLIFFVVAIMGFEGRCQLEGLCWCRGLWLDWRPWSFLLWIVWLGHYFFPHQSSTYTSGYALYGHTQPGIPWLFRSLQNGSLRNSLRSSLCRAGRRAVFPFWLGLCIPTRAVWIPEDCLFFGVVICSRCTILMLCCRSGSGDLRLFRWFRGLLLVRILCLPKME